MLGVTQYYCHTRSEYRAESSSMWIFLVCLLLFFFLLVSYSAIPLHSVDCFCSSCRLKASLLARFALVHRLFLLFLARSASICRLFLLFLSIKSFSSRPLCSSPSIVSAVLVARSASARRLFLLF